MKVDLEPGGFLAVRLEELKNEIGKLDSNLEQSAAVEYALNPHGKLIRPLTLFATANALGLSEDKAIVNIAIGIEKLHIATLIHDDIIDNDQWRRGRPSLHAEYDLTTAIVAGDSLILSSTAWVNDIANDGIDPSTVVEILNRFAIAGQQLCSGQLLESRMTSSLSFKFADYIRMVRGKTGALFELAAGCGAILAEADSREIGRFSNVGKKFGMAFQMQDDLLPYISAQELAGKDLLSDFRNKRPSFPVVVATESLEGADQATLLSILTSETNADTESFYLLHELFLRTGVLHNCRELLRHTLEESKAQLVPYSDTEGGRFLLELLDQTARRSL